LNEHITALTIPHVQHGSLAVEISSEMDENSVPTPLANPQNPAPAPRYVANMMSSRYSVRAFLKTPIPRNILEDVFAISQHAPSNSNIQPWRVKIVTGDALQRLTSALLSAVSSGVAATTEPIPESYQHHRSALGRKLYGPEGYDIPRTDAERLREAQLRNYRFFDAPCALIVCMEQSLAQVDVLSVGMYLQTLCLLLAERDIGTCVQASVAGYPQVRHGTSYLAPSPQLIQKPVANTSRQSQSN
jgi:nitroreductase